MNKKFIYTLEDMRSETKPNSDEDIALSQAIKALEERPQGEWILNKDENPECPFCHYSFTYWANFCGNCGADMRGNN